MSGFRRTFRLTHPDEAGAALALLAAEGFEWEREPFWDMAFALTHEPKPLGSSLAAAFGLIYIQDRSSMLPPLLLAPEPGSAVVDLCASPGGKTGIAAMLAGMSGFVLSNEPQAKRSATLRLNLIRSGAANVGTCSASGENLALRDGSWPCILMDPPCSGWGTEEKHPKVKTLWKGEKIEPLVKLQQMLLRRASALLAPGGRLMYSTCTTNPDENEAQVEFAVRELGLELVPLSPPPAIVVDEPSNSLCSGCLRVTGGESGGQGFFLAMFTRSGQVSEEPAQAAALGRTLKPAEREGMAYCYPDRLPPGEIRIFGETAYFVHEQASGLLPEDFKWRGYSLGRIKGSRFHVEPRARVLVPPDNCTAVNIEEIEPLVRLISGQSLNVEQQGGYVGLLFRDAPLGWLAVKNGRALWTARS